MLDILRDYCDIYTSTQAWDRKARHARIQQWAQTQYPALPTYAELTAFLAMIERQDTIKISLPFESRVLFPVFDREIFVHKNVDAIKLLLGKYNSTAFLQYKQDYALDLLDVALGYAPDDPQLLQRQFDRQKRYFAYTLHEVPWGVLYDANGASVTQTQELLAGVEAFEALCVRLQRNEDALIAKCRFYYNLWMRFLTDKRGCVHFDAFLHQYGQQDA